MARFRRRASRRRGGFFKRMLRGRRSGKGLSPEKIIIPAAIYGAGRQYLVNLAAPLTSKIPFGNYADEVLFGLAGYMAAKKGRGMIKQLGMAVLTVEAASLGHQIVGGAVSGIQQNAFG